jgi:hypothetical protein
VERLLVLGVDGLDGGLLASSGADASEHLLALLARGAVYPKRHKLAEPAEVWTTIATGMPTDAHGVRQAGASQLPGIAAPIAARSGPVAIDAALRFLLPTRTVPATGAGRRVRALWEIAGLERKSAVAAEFPANKAVWHASFDARFASFPENVRALVWESFLIDAFAWRTALLILDDPLLSTEIAYLPGLDILRSRLSGLPGRDETVAAYLRWLDATVFTELAARPGERLVIVADPGRSAGAGAEGFVAAVGGGATPRCVGPAVDDLDVAPIVLREASLPASGEMQGRAPDRCFEGAAAAPPKIATWGRRGRAAAQRGSDYDPEMVERLKSLGYLR